MNTRQIPNEFHLLNDEKKIAVKVTDIFGNDGLKVIHVTVS